MLSIVDQGQTWEMGGKGGGGGGGGDGGGGGVPEEAGVQFLQLCDTLVFSSPGLLHVFNLAFCLRLLSHPCFTCVKYHCLDVCNEQW